MVNNFTASSLLYQDFVAENINVSNTSKCEGRLAKLQFEGIIQMYSVSLITYIRVHNLVP